MFPPYLTPSPSPGLRLRPPWRRYGHDSLNDREVAALVPCHRNLSEILPLELAGNLPSGCLERPPILLSLRICCEPNQRDARGSCLLLSAAGCLEPQSQELQKLRSDRSTSEPGRESPYIFQQLYWQSTLLNISSAGKEETAQLRDNKLIIVTVICLINEYVSFTPSPLLTRFLTPILQLARFLFLNRI